MIRVAIGAVVAATVLGGCTIPIKFRTSPDCRAGGTIGYIGQRYNERIGRIVKDKSRANAVRLIAHDTVIIQDLRASRINIALDERNTVTGIYCG